MRPWLSHPRSTEHPARTLVLDRATRAPVISILGYADRARRGRGRRARRCRITPPGRTLDDATSTLLAGDLGWEASGCYVQTFDLATGKRLSSHMNRAW